MKICPEGWVISLNTKYGTRIEMNDEDTRFKSDLEALEFVIQQARNGSQHHIDALAECGYWWEK
jgi:hypothetical protein